MGKGEEEEGLPSRKNTLEKEEEKKKRQKTASVLIVGVKNQYESGRRFLRRCGRKGGGEGWWEVVVGVSAGGLAPHSKSMWEGCAHGIIHGNACFTSLQQEIFFRFIEKKTNSQAEDDADRLAARIIQVGGAWEVGGAEGRGAVPAVRNTSSFRLEGQ